MNQVGIEKIHIPNAGKLPPLDKNKGEHFKFLQVKKEYRISQEVIDDCLKDVD